MPYALFASILTTILVIRFVLDDDNGVRARGLVVALLFAGLTGSWLGGERMPVLAVPSLLLQVGLAIFLLMHARYRGD